MYQNDGIAVAGEKAQDAMRLCEKALTAAHQGKQGTADKQCGGYTVGNIGNIFRDGVSHQDGEEQAEHADMQIQAVVSGCLFCGHKVAKDIGSQPGGQGGGHTETDAQKWQIRGEQIQNENEQHQRLEHLGVEDF